VTAVRHAADYRREILIRRPRAVEVMFGKLRSRNPLGCAVGISDKWLIDLTLQKRRWGMLAGPRTGVTGTRTP